MARTVRVMRSCQIDAGDQSVRHCINETIIRGEALLANQQRYTLKYARDQSIWASDHG